MRFPSSLIANFARSLKANDTQHIIGNGSSALQKAYAAASSHAAARGYDFEKPDTLKGISTDHTFFELNSKFIELLMEESNAKPEIGGKSGVRVLDAIEPQINNSSAQQPFAQNVKEKGPIYRLFERYFTSKD